MYGPTVTFGSFCGEDGVERPLEWKVIGVYSGHILILCKDIIARKPFNDRADLTSWKNSTIRKWLNEDFYNAAFDSEERAMIDEVDTDRGVDDRIFLLSGEESDEFFGTLQGYECGEVYWLRSDNRDRAQVINRVGMRDHRQKDDDRIGVLPALYVDLN